MANIDSLVNILKNEGLGEEDILFIVENKIVAQQAAEQLKKICDDVRRFLNSPILDDTKRVINSLKARQLLLQGRFPSNSSERNLLRIAQTCLSLNEKKPGFKIIQKAVAKEMGISQQRISQIMGKRDFIEMLGRLDLV